MSADDRQSQIEIDVGFVLALSDALEGGEQVLHEIAHQSAAFVASGRGHQCCLESWGIPPLGQLPPTAVASAAFPLVQLGEELVVAERLPVLRGVLEDVVGQVHARKRRTGM